jgi:hypothetical protein
MSEYEITPLEGIPDDTNKNMETPAQTGPGDGGNGVPNENPEINLEVNAEPSQNVTPDPTIAPIVEPDVDVEYQNEVATAKANGWVPKEEFKGSRLEKRGISWVDAGEFNRRKSTMAQIRSMEARIRDQNEAIAMAKQTFEGFEARLTEAQQDAYERGRQEIIDAHDYAIEEGNFDRAKQLAEDLVAHVENKPTEPAPVPAAPTPGSVQPQQDIDPDLNSWISRNPWFRNDQFLQEQTILFGKRVEAENPNLKGPAYYEAVGNMVKDKFPEMFGGERRVPANVAPVTNAAPVPETVSIKDITDPTLKRRYNIAVKDFGRPKADMILQEWKRTGVIV